MTADGYCPRCGTEWRDMEPGDSIRCPGCERRVVLVAETDAGDPSNRL